MTAILAIARRETSAYFSGPIGWIVLLAFTIMWGFFFVAMLVGYSDASAQSAFSPDMADQMNINEWIVQPMFGNMGVIALLISPVLTMRLIAEDRSRRSIELLLTSPITSWQIVIGKFLGSIGFVVVALLFTAHFPAILYWLGTPDTNILLCNYLGFALLMATFIADGLFFSSLTENQIVAAIAAFGFNLIIWVFSWSGQGMDDGTAKTVIEYISMLNHLEKLGKGTLHLQDAAYFTSFIGFFLFATVQRVEALRWR